MQRKEASSSALKDEENWDMSTLQVEATLCARKVGRTGLPGHTSEFSVAAAYRLCHNYSTLH